MQIPAARDARLLFIRGPAKSLLLGPSFHCTALILLEGLSTCGSGACLEA